MHFTNHAIIMSLLLFTVLAVLAGSVARRVSWYSIKMTYIIIILTLIRFLIPFESFDAILIKEKYCYPFLYSLIQVNIFSNIKIWHALCLIWLIGSIIYLTLFAINLHKQMCFIKSYRIPKSHALYQLCSRCANKIGFSYSGKICVSSAFKSPMMTGLLRPYILLPENVYSMSNEQLSCIFYHELYHFKNHDLWIKLTMQMLCGLLWWNPIVYFFKKSIDQMLEVRCDKNVCSLLTQETKILYTETMLSFLKNMTSTPMFATGYNGEGKKSNFEHRTEQIFETRKRFSLLHIGFVIVSVSIFILSYQFTLQPYFPPPSVENEVIVDESQQEQDSSFILKQADGSFWYYEKGEHRAILTEDMLKEEPYCNIPIYDGY